MASDDSRTLLQLRLARPIFLPLLEGLGPRGRSGGCPRSPGCYPGVVLVFGVITAVAADLAGVNLALKWRQSCTVPRLHGH